MKKSWELYDNYPIEENKRTSLTFGKINDTYTPFFATYNVQIIYRHRNHPINPTNCNKINKELRNNIKSFDRNNKFANNPTNPIILPKKKKSTMNEILKIKTIPLSYQRVKSLRGEKQIIALIDIPINQPLGYYCGTQYTEKEWCSCWNWTTDDSFHRRYIYRIYPAFRSIIIDPIDANLHQQKYRLLYINDIRRDLTHCEFPNEKEKKNENCKFLNIKKNGWIYPLIYTTKTIKKGNELLIDYGQEYTLNLKQCNHWDKSIKT